MNDWSPSSCSSTKVDSCSIGESIGILNKDISTPPVVRKNWNLMKTTTTQIEAGEHGIAAKFMTITQIEAGEHGIAGCVVRDSKSVAQWVDLRSRIDQLPRFHPNRHDQNYAPPNILTDMSMTKIKIFMKSEFQFISKTKTDMFMHSLLRVRWRRSRSIIPALYMRPVCSR